MQKDLFALIMSTCESMLMESDALAEDSCEKICSMIQSEGLSVKDAIHSSFSLGMSLVIETIRRSVSI